MRVYLVMPPLGYQHALGRAGDIRDMTGRVTETAVELLYDDDDHGNRATWWASVDSVEALDPEAEALILPLRAAARLKREAWKEEVAEMKRLQEEVLRLHRQGVRWG